MLLASSLQSFLELIGVLVIFVFVLILTWLTTRWMANYQKGHTKAKNLELIETIRVGGNKTLSIVKAGKKFFVISVGKEEVNVVGELAEEDLTDLSFKNTSTTSSKESFANILSKFKDTLPSKQDKDE